MRSNKLLLARYARALSVVVFFAAPLYAEDAVLNELLEQPPLPETTGERDASAADGADAESESGSTQADAESQSADDESNSERGSEAKADSADSGDAPSSVGKETPREADDASAADNTKDQLEGVSCSNDGPCVVDATGLPLRALARSFSPLFDAPADGAKAISSAVSAFKPLHVFAVQGIDRSDAADTKGWYQIGFSPRRAIGWMRANDVVEWRQALLLEYLHPGSADDRRLPVVMFETQDALEGVVRDPSRADRALSILEEIEAGHRPEGVIGREGREFLNIDETFYLLPIIDWERDPTFDEPSHYLQAFAAVPGARAEKAGEGTLADEAFLAETLTNKSADGLVDLVFVMDMTGSMKPYIDSVKRMIKTLTEDLPSEHNTDAIRFGLVGYRDSVGVSPELQWNVRNFTEEALVDASTLSTLLESEVGAATVSSDEWAEDVHGGFQAGIDSPWRTNEVDERSIRVLVLVGDASGHDIDSEKNSTGITAADLNAQARGLGIFPYTIYLQDERAEPDWLLAESQFAAFGSGGRGDSAATISVSTVDAESNLDQTGRYIAEELSRKVAELNGALPGPSNSIIDSAPDVDNEEGRQMIEIARGVMQAALVDFLGNDEVPPKDFASWVHDYDLADSSREVLGVRVLVTRKQLDNVLGQTEALLDAMSANTIGNIDFLLALQQTAASTALGRDFDAESSLANQELLPRWISALPYQSRILQMSPAEFSNLKMTSRRELESATSSKVETYRKLLSSPDRWLQLDPSDDTLDEVLALPLTLLP